MENKAELVQINYTNYQGITSDRVIRPEQLYFGSTSYHPEPQWLLLAFDTQKGLRTFAMQDIHRWFPYAEPSTQEPGVND
jgi:predicted DNA-binding transcriptional regulator YafY